MLKKPEIMGVLNVTPDSFSDGRVYDANFYVNKAWELYEQGASIIDIGGESTRPYAQSISLQEELERVLPVLKQLHEQKFPGILSIDTYKPQVAEIACDYGVQIINDIYGLTNPDMLQAAIQKNVYVIAMHMRKTPETMQEDIVYQDVVSEVKTFLTQAKERFIHAGGKPEKIWLDVGLGFGKTTAHNLQLTHHLETFTSLECPLVYGPSRKKFLGEITGKNVLERDEATAAICAIAVFKGAAVLRVHNPKAVHDAIAVAAALAKTPKI